MRQVMDAIARHAGFERFAFDVVPDAHDVIGSPVNRARRALERADDAPFTRHAGRGSVARADERAAGFGLQDHRTVQEPAGGDRRDPDAAKVDADDDVETGLELKGFRKDARQHQPFAAATTIADRSDPVHADIVDLPLDRLLAAHAFRHDLDLKAGAIQVRREPARVRLHSTQHGMVVRGQNEDARRHRASTVRLTRLQYSSRRRS